MTDAEADVPGARHAALWRETFSAYLALAVAPGGPYAGRCAHMIARNLCVGRVRAGGAWYQAVGWALRAVDGRADARADALARLSPYFGLHRIDGPDADRPDPAGVVRGVTTLEAAVEYLRARDAGEGGR